MKAFSRILLMLLFLAAPTTDTTLYAADLHVFLVGDYFSTDIRNASQTDVKAMREEAMRIANHINYNLKISLFVEGKAGTELVKSLKSLTLAKDDAVLFYFSGHGYRPHKDAKSSWPYLDFPLEHHGVKFQDIINRITELKPKWALMIADCCNWTLASDELNPPLVKRRFRSGPKDIQKNYRALFGNLKGCLAVASAKPGQASFCKSSGSFYTLSFLEAIHEVAGGRFALSWNSVLALSNRHLLARLKPYGLEQSPVIRCTFE